VHQVGFHYTEQHTNFLIWDITIYQSATCYLYFRNRWQFRISRRWLWRL